MSDYRILVTGSRSWTDRDRISFELGLAIGESGRGLDEIVIVHGACPRGADAMAEGIALAYGYRRRTRPTGTGTGMARGLGRERPAGTSLANHAQRKVVSREQSLR